MMRSACRSGTKAANEGDEGPYAGRESSNPVLLSDPRANRCLVLSGIRLRCWLIPRSDLSLGVVRKQLREELR